MKESFNCHGDSYITVLYHSQLYALRALNILWLYTIVTSSFYFTRSGTSSQWRSTLEVWFRQLPLTSGGSEPESWASQLYLLVLINPPKQNEPKCTNFRRKSTALSPDPTHDWEQGCCRKFLFPGTLLLSFPYPFPFRFSSPIITHPPSPFPLSARGSIRISG